MTSSISSSSLSRADTNVILIPDRKWGVVVMENGENSTDEFFGSRRMTGIANGVAGMLIGEEPPPPSSPSRSLWVVYGVVLGILVVQVAGMVRSVRTIRSWRSDPLRRPTRALRIGFRVGLPLLVSWTWAFVVLVGLPQVIGAPLLGRPDGTTRPWLPAGCQRPTRLRLGPGQSDLGNPDPAHAASRYASLLEWRHRPS
jgi:hypothetical protein